LLPDHLHALWTLPEGDDDYSARWSIIKRRFAKTFLLEGGTEQPLSESRRRNRRRGVWQRRFWERVVRANEFDEIISYIHFNPVKHGLVSCPHDWPWSTFHQWVARGELDRNWECVCDRDGDRPDRSFNHWFDQCE
jgi:putative transposase